MNKLSIRSLIFIPHLCNLYHIIIQTHCATLRVCFTKRHATKRQRRDHFEEGKA